MKNRNIASLEAELLLSERVILLFVIIMSTFDAISSSEERLC